MKIVFITLLLVVLAISATVDARSWAGSSSGGQWHWSYAPDDQGVAWSYTVDPVRSEGQGQSKAPPTGSGSSSGGQGHHSEAPPPDVYPAPLVYPTQCLQAIVNTQVSCLPETLFAWIGWGQQTVGETCCTAVRQAQEYCLDTGLEQFSIPILATSPDLLDHCSKN